MSLYIKMFTPLMQGCHRLRDQMGFICNSASATGRKAAGCLTPSRAPTTCKCIYDTFTLLKAQCQGWVTCFYVCQSLARDTLDSITIQLLHFCLPWLSQQRLPPQSVFLLPRGLVCFRMGWVSIAQHHTQRTNLIFLNPLNPFPAP